MPICGLQFYRNRFVDNAFNTFRKLTFGLSTRFARCMEVKYDIEFGSYWNLIKLSK
jgi:hypothetical protein